MEIDLTQGRITRKLWLFALPLMLGNLMQQIYHLVDTWVVGRYIGEQALAAVGASYTLMTFLTSVVIGLCLGSSVFFSIAWGQRREERLRNGVWISFLTIGASSLLLTGAVMLLMRPIMVLLHIPQELEEACQSYLRWIFPGIPAIFLYNYWSNLLRGIGNAATPLVFLGFSVLLNTGLDLLLVIHYRLGIEGAAKATLLSQYLAGAGLMVYTSLRYHRLLPGKDDRHWNAVVIRQIAALSGFTCLQQSVMNFGILMIQGLVNSFGASVMAAFAVAVKIDTIAYMPVQDFGNAFSTFVAQNAGAGQKARIREGIRLAMLSVLVFCVLISTAVCITAPSLMGIFVEQVQQEVIALGTAYLRIEGACYLGIGILFLMYGYYRAVHLPWMSVILTVISLGTRVVLAYSCSPVFGVTAIWWAIPIGWLLADLTGALCYRFSLRKMNDEIR